MNENHYTGNLTADPEVRPISSGGVVVRFRIAINGRRHNGQQWVNREPIFKNVVCFRKLADNAAASLRSGMAVTVVGTEVDDSWKPADGDKITRTVIEAVNVLQNRRRSKKWTSSTMNRWKWWNRRPK